MKRILILTGATLVAFAALAREILYVGATGGSWQAIGNWVNRETEQPITELWDGDIACFNPGESVSLEVVNNASGVLNFGGIKVLSGAVTVSGWNNMHFFLDSGALDVAEGASLVIDGYIWSKGAAWEYSDCVFRKSGKGRATVRGSIGHDKGGNNHRLPYLYVDEGSLVIEKNAAAQGNFKQSVITELTVKSGASFVANADDAMLASAQVTVTVEKGGTVEVNGGYFRANGFNGAGTVMSTAGNAKLVWFLSKHDCEFSGTISGMTLELAKSDTSSDEYVQTILNPHALEGLTGLTAWRDVNPARIVFGPAVRDAFLGSSATARVLSRLPVANTDGKPLRYVTTTVPVDADATRLSNLLVCAPENGYMNYDFEVSKLYTNPRNAGVVVRYDAQSSLALDGTRMRLGKDGYNFPSMGSFSVSNGGVAEFITPMSTSGSVSGDCQATLDGGTLRIYYPWGDFFQNDRWTVAIGEKGGRIEGMSDVRFDLGSQFDDWRAGIANAAGVTTADPLTIAISRNVMFNKPITLTTPVRYADGRPQAKPSAYANGVTAVFGAGDIRLANACLRVRLDVDEMTPTTLAATPGSKLIAEGCGRIEFSGRPVVIGPAAASEPVIAREKGGALFFFEPDENRPVDGTHGKITVNGPLAKDESGRLVLPVFTQAKMFSDIGTDQGQKTNYRIDFAGYDDAQGLVQLSDPDTVLAEAESDRTVCLDSRTAPVTVAADTTRYAGALQLKGPALTIEADGVLRIGSGANTACVILDSLASRDASIAGAGTLDFGAREGLFALNISQSAGTGPTISALIAGSGGVSFVCPHGTKNAWIALSAANAYSGGTWINGVQVRARNAAAFGEGPVHVGPGQDSGGQVLFDLAGATLTNDFAISGNGPMWASEFNRGALWFARKATLTGAVAIDRRVRISTASDSIIGTDADQTGTFAGEISGGALQIAPGTSPIVFTHANTYSGGTEILRSELILRGAGTAGAGPVRLDAGVLRFENDEPTVFGNDLAGVGFVQLAGSAPVSFASARVSGDGIGLDLCGTRQTFDALPPFSAITNSSDKVAAVILAGEQGTVAWGDRTLSPAKKIEFEIGEGTMLDLGGQTLTVRSMSEGSRKRIVNGEIVETNPKRGIILIVR